MACSSSKHVDALPTSRYSEVKLSNTKSIWPAHQPRPNPTHTLHQKKLNTLSPLSARPALQMSKARRGHSSRHATVTPLQISQHTWLTLAFQNPCCTWIARVQDGSSRAFTFTTSHNSRGAANSRMHHTFGTAMGLGDQHAD